MKNSILILGITILIGALSIFSCLSIIGDKLTGDKNEGLACPPLPENFKESDLVGSWIGRYFENKERIIIRDDGTYKQIFSNDFLNFESEWQKWYIEYAPQGYIRLHMVGMRRCDGLESECNDPGGGLPSHTLVINPCDNISMAYPDDEITLFVTGSTSDTPRGIMFQQATFAGSDWKYTFRLEEPENQLDGSAVP